MGNMRTDVLLQHQTVPTGDKESVKLSKQKSVANNKNAISVGKCFKSLYSEHTLRGIRCVIDESIYESIRRNFCYEQI